MRTRKRFLLAALALLLSVSAVSALADDAQDAREALKAPDASLLHERVLSVPGDPENPVMLQTTLFTPEGSGPFPLAIMNHGATKDAPPEEQPRYHLTFSAYYFLSRGYAVALPMMRGYAGSSGKLLRHGCDDVAVGLDAARDIRSVIEYMKQQPGIDGSRIVVAGQSFGGWNTLALGTLNVPDVKGLVSFAGGMKASDCPDPDAALIDSAGVLGAHTTIPSIWFFGDNDAVFATATWHAMHEHYTASGGKAELVAYGTYMSDSHNLLSSEEGLHLWIPKLDAFLARVGLPSKMMYPEYLPMPVPPPSGYAKLDDVNSVPYMRTDQERAFYKKFVNRPLPRALAVGPRGISSTSGGFDPLAQALKLCAQQSPNCRLYAVDNDVVWTRPTSVPPPTRFAELSDVNAVPHLNEQGRTGYQGFLAMLRPRAFAVAPDGGWDAASLGPDPVAYALTACNRLHPGCRLYAVDGDVVWPGNIDGK
jgi:dienelactone hydrolase